MNLATYRISFNKPKHCNIDIPILQMENPWLMYSVQEAFWEPAALEGGEESGPSLGELSVFRPGPALLAWKPSNKGHSLP